jgi:hypothetical protein
MEFYLKIFIDCLNDMVNPEGALAIKKNIHDKVGTCNTVKPMANVKIEDTRNLIGKIYYAVFTDFYIPNW